MTSKDFVDWKHHPMTVEVFRVWKHRHDELVEELINQSYSMEPRKQAEHFAAIKVYREILEMAPEETYDY